MDLKQMREQADQKAEESTGLVERARAALADVAEEAAQVAAPVVEEEGRLPRTACPICQRDTPLRRGGELREHKANPADESNCPASGYSPEVARSMALTEAELEDEGLAGKIDPPPVTLEAPAARSSEEEMFGQSYAFLPLHVVTYDHDRDPGDLEELAESIKETQGLLQPILVEPDLEASGNGETIYRVVDGRRRREAAELAGMMGVLAIIRPPGSAPDRRKDALVANLHRKDITPLEEARGYQELLSYGMEQKDIAAAMKRSPGHVSKRLSLIGLPDELQKAVHDGEVTLETAHTVSRLKNRKAIEATLEAAKGKEWVSGEKTLDGRLRVIAEGALEKAEADARRRTTLKELEAKGVKIVDPDTFVRYPLKWGAGPRTIGRSYGDLNANATEHEKEPCHVAYLDPAGKVRPGCSEPDRHKRGGASKLTTTINGLPKAAKRAKEDPEAKARRIERETQEARFVEIATARRAHVANALRVGRRLDLKDLATVRASTWLANVDEGPDNEVLAELLGLDYSTEKAGGDWQKASLALTKLLVGDDGTPDPEASYRFLLAEVVSMAEAGLRPFSRLYRASGQELEPISWAASKPYFEWLVRIGYKLDELEIRWVEMEPDE